MFIFKTQSEAILNRFMQPSRPLRRVCLGWISILVLALSGAYVHAEEAYPDRPVKLIVSFAAGSVTDIMGRMYANQLGQQLGQPVIVDDRPGATGAIGANVVAKSAPDGYTLVLNSSALVINPWVVKQPFDFFKDLTPVARTAYSAYLITVNPKLPIHNLNEFVAYAKKNPGKLLCATYGIASPPHIALELLKREAGIDVVHVPYKTFEQAYPDLVSGQLSCSIDPPTVPARYVREGRIRAIAQTGSTPLSIFPELDAVGKRYPAATVIGWQAVFAPRAIPQPVLRKLRAEWRKVLASPEIAKKITEFGFEPGNDSIESFKKSIKEDYENYGRVIRENNIHLERDPNG
jgi:tripartite-type tricarboxylate transporter receptor subunit TctC